MDSDGEVTTPILSTITYLSAGGPTLVVNQAFDDDGLNGGSEKMSTS